MQVEWIKSQAGTWLDLRTVNLTDVSAFGVYVIWHGGNPSQVVRVGQGSIADRLTAHRSDPAILAYADKGLYVTWATVQVSQADGVERFLANHYLPLVGDRHPAVAPIAVNLPSS
jgi:hypothetical protein